MAFLDCLEAKVKEGLLTKGQLERLENKFESRVAQYRNSMGNEQAAAQAAADIVEAEGLLLAEKKRNEINAALAQQRIVAQLDEFAATGRPYDEGVRNLLERSLVRKNSIMKQHLANLDEFIDAFRSKFAGLYRRTDGIVNVVEELLGKQTANAEAKQFAGGVRRMFDNAHARYKASGGIIGKLDNYFPQVHERKLLEAVTFEEWHNFIRPRLDTDKMIDFETGLPFNEEKLVRVMEEDYLGIVSGGKADLQKRAAEGKQTFGVGSEISQRKMASRFYHFKDADSFLEYNDKFGVGESGLFDTILNHVEALSRDTAILEVMGPRPNAMMRHLNLQMAAHDVGANRQKWTNGMYDVLTGFVDSSAGESPMFSAIGNLQNLFSAAYLGSAPISALSDATFISMASKFNGMNGAKALARYGKLLNPANAKDRALAKRSGYIADVARGRALGDARFTGESLGGKATTWLAQFTNRASGLAAMTKAAADAVSLEFEATLAELADAGTTWGKLDDAFRNILEAHDITREDWGVIMRAGKLEPERGVKFLTSNEISLVKGIEPDVALNIATKIDDVSFTLRQLATNEPTLRTRSITTGAFATDDARRGTAARAILSSFTQFKGFPITVMFTHLLPSLREAQTGNLSRLGFMTVGTTVLGALAMQMKQVAVGKDFRDPEDWRFWGAAMLQGGGLGLFGDFFFSDYSRFGRNISEEITGPAVGFANDILRTFNGNLNRIIEDDTGKSWDKFRRDTFNLAKRNLPAVNLWYSRLVVERLLLDEIEKVVDRNFEKNTRRLERRIFKDTGQKYFWRKGEALPRRAPEVAERGE